MSSRRHILFISALLVAGCATGAADRATSVAQDVVPNAWQSAGEDVAAPTLEDPLDPAATPDDPSGVAAGRVRADAASPGSDAVPVQDGRTTPAPFGTPLPPAVGVPEPQVAARPVALRIPALGIEGAVVRGVGVEPSGAMEIPRADEVGWYRFGPGPGQVGSQVLAAHIASNGVDGVFRHLDRLEQGDLVEVVDEDGVIHSYEIVGLGEFEKSQLPFDQLFARDGSERLALITCGGDWNPQLRSYDSNVVAFAMPVSA